MAFLLLPFSWWVSTLQVSPTIRLRANEDRNDLLSLPMLTCPFFQTHASASLHPSGLRSGVEYRAAHKTLDSKSAPSLHHSEFIEHSTMGPGLL